MHTIQSRDKKLECSTPHYRVLPKVKVDKSYTRNGIIVTSKVCFYFISCRKTISKRAKLHLNEKVQSETEIGKSLVEASDLVLKLTFSAFYYTAGTIPVTVLLYIFCIHVCTK